MCCKKWLALSASVIVLTACGGGGGSDGGTTPVTPSTGIFEDAVVSGLSYSTPTRSGVTNTAGEYDYIPGETVTFSIGGIVLGSALAGPVVTPLLLVPGALDETNPTVTNIVRLLLTLDDNGDPDIGGITISAATTTAAAGLSVDFTVADIITETDVATLLAALPGAPTLTDATTAQTHFAMTLAAQSNWGELAWGTGTWQSAP